MHFSRKTRHWEHGFEPTKGSSTSRSLFLDMRTTYISAPLSSCMFPISFTTLRSAWILLAQYPEPLLLEPNPFVASAIIRPRFISTATWILAKCAYLRFTVLGLLRIWSKSHCSLCLITVDRVTAF